MAKFMTNLNLWLLSVVVGLILSVPATYLYHYQVRQASYRMHDGLQASQAQFLDLSDEYLELARDRADLRLILKQHDNHVDLED